MTEQDSDPGSDEGTAAGYAGRATTVYPARLDAALEPGLSRGLWLVKWILIIPHAVILFFLWIAFLVLTIIAFFPILITGRYPRSIFDFNLGVLRWAWRVAYYSYSGLGTDRYPPFTLAEVPDYPARLAVVYPGELSRGLVLIKWWLLVIPHYLLIGAVSGGIRIAIDRSPESTAQSISVLTLLVLLAALAVLFTGRYPGKLFDLVIGMNRWGFRVGVYAALMTDRYPPFRLDQGGPDPDGPAVGMALIDEPVGDRRS